MSESIVPLGLDLAKLSFEAHLRLPVGCPRKGFANTAEGFEQLDQWVKSHGVRTFHACLEATGTYGDELALSLYEHGYQVSIVNPAKVAAFRKSEGIRTKNDQQDAKVLALYCEKKEPPLWKPTPAEVQLLANIVNRRADLQAMRQQEVNRLENSRWDQQTLQGLQVHIESLATQISELTKRIRQQMKAHKELQEQREYLVSLPGIADLTAARVMAMGVSPDNFHSASQLVGYTGLAINESQSGTSVRGKACIDRIGNAQLRKALSMPALVAKRCDPDFARLAAELKARGKPNKVIIVAVMRKLLHLISGVLKSKQPYDPRKAFPTHYPQEVPPAA